MEPTAGPWIKSKSGTEITTADGVSIALVSIRPLEWDANGDLLAAAPDLLAAVEALVGAMIAYEMDVDSDAPPQHRAMMAAARAAIAKAKGGTL